MTIINNRKKIQSEVPSKEYKDGWDRIFNKNKKNALEEYIDNNPLPEYSKEVEDKMIEELKDDKVQFCNKCSSCSGTDDMCNCSCLQGDGKG